MTDLGVSIELFQPCSDDCRGDDHALLVFTELWATRADVIGRVAEMLGTRVADAQEVPEVESDNDDRPEAWRVWIEIPGHSRHLSGSP